MQLGCIADDFTGATDLAGTLVKSGMSAVQLIGVPEGNIPPVEADAGVIALKSRTIPAAEAVAQSIAALDWLRDQGCTQFFFKYCSTFDSTESFERSTGRKAETRCRPRAVSAEQPG